MTAGVKIVGALLLLSGMAVLVVAVIVIAGIMEGYLPLAEMWNSDSAQWVLVLGVAALTFSVMALAAMFYFASLYRRMDAKLDQGLGEMREQWHALKSIDANLGRLISICADNRAARSNLENKIKELSNERARSKGAPSGK
jgi:low affinity Fe/Cu permease